MPALFTGLTFWSLGLLVLGLICFVAELFHPGFGVFGVLGLLALGLDILISSETLAQGLLFTALAAVIVFLFLLVSARLISKGKLPKKLVLREENSASEGFSASEARDALLGKTGTAATVLRPAGIAVIGGKRIDVVTQGEYLEQNTLLRVIDMAGGRIVVGLAGETERAE